MKRRLLKPPANDKEVLLIPDIERIRWLKEKYKRWAVAHQIDFFNPGIAIKFLFLDFLDLKDRYFVFLDTDRINLNIEIPYTDVSLEILNSDEVLMDFKINSKNYFLDKLKDVEYILKETKDRNIIKNFENFKVIFLKKLKARNFLKDVLTESFLEYFRINRNFFFLSDILKGDFKDFFNEIYSRSDEFRDIFNSLIDEYRENFKFRFKNYPFPKLKESELPFWKVVNSRRYPLYKKEFQSIRNIIPRAVTLTLFLRLKKCDIFIHGVGGGNYEWIQDNLIERFFKGKKKEFVVVCGSFFINQKRDFPYFFFDSGSLKNTLFPIIQKIT